MNRPQVLVASVSTLATLLLASSAHAQSAGLDRGAAQVTRARAGAPLTSASNAAPSTIVSNYLRARGRSPAVLASLQSARESTVSRGMRNVRIQQEVDGIEVHGAYLKAVLNARGELVHVID